MPTNFKERAKTSQNHTKEMENRNKINVSEFKEISNKPLKFRDEYENMDTNSKEVDNFHSYYRSSNLNLSNFNLPKYKGKFGFVPKVPIYMLELFDSQIKKPRQMTSKGEIIRGFTPVSSGKL